MWYREFKDYPPDKPLKKSQVEPGAGIFGTEMHELNGWGESYQIRPKKKHGLLTTYILEFFGLFHRKEQ